MGGLSFPIGKATIGSKRFGYERDQWHEGSSGGVANTVHFTVLHSLPTVQINLIETTVLLSLDAKSDIKKAAERAQICGLTVLLRQIR